MPQTPSLEMKGENIMLSVTPVQISDVNNNTSLDAIMHSLGISVEDQIEGVREYLQEEKDINLTPAQAKKAVCQWLISSFQEIGSDVINLACGDRNTSFNASAFKEAVSEVK